jgi:hypothetical protein
MCPEGQPGLNLGGYDPNQSTPLRPHNHPSLKIKGKRTTLGPLSNYDGCRGPRVRFGPGQTALHLSCQIDLVRGTRDGKSTFSAVNRSLDISIDCLMMGSPPKLPMYIDAAPLLRGIPYPLPGYGGIIDQHIYSSGSHPGSPRPGLSWWSALQEDYLSLSPVMPMKLLGPLGD